MFNYNKNFLYILLLGSVVSACFSNHVETEPKSIVKAVRKRTVLPASYLKELPEDLQFTKLLIPKNTLYVAQTKRPNVEVREGPGVSFKLKDSLLYEGQELLSFDKVANWRLVVDFENGASGWVHQKTITKVGLNSENILIDVKHLPAFFAVADLKNVFTYPARKSIGAKIPKDSVFIGLTVEGKDILVWLKQTNSLMWLPKSFIY